MTSTASIQRRCAGCALFLGAVIFPAAAQSVKTPAKISDAVWTLDLATQGYVPDPGDAFRAQIPALRKISFLTDSTIIATFIERVTTTGLHRRDDPNRTPPFKLHAVFLDAATGSMQRTQSWNSDSSEIGILPAADGTYAVYEGNVIYKFSVEGKPLGELRIPSAEGSGVGIWAVAVSPTGRTILAQYRSDSKIQCEWIRTDSMTTNGQACQIPESASISDAEIAAHEDRKKQTDPNKIYVSKLGGEWKPICVSEDGSGCAVVDFLSDQTLLAHNAGKLEVLQNDGKNIFEQDLTQQVEVASSDTGTVSSSRGGLRVGILLWNSPFSNNVVRTPGAGPNGETGVTLTPKRIVVLDVETKKWIFALENKSPQLREMDFALSPGGNALVLKSEGTVRLFHITDRSKQ